MSRNCHTNLPTYVASVLLIGVYLLSYIGFSIHSCSCEDSIQISVMIGNPSCEDLHTHIPVTKGDFHHCEHHHDDGCCSTEVLVLTTDQTNPDHQSLFEALSSLSVGHHSYPDLLETLYCSESPHSDVVLDPIHPLRHYRSFLSVWRL